MRILTQKKVNNPKNIGRDKKSLINQVGHCGLPMNKILIICIIISEVELLVSKCLWDTEWFTMYHINDF